MAPSAGEEATVAPVSTGFQILVMLHILCVIGGFGAVSYNGLYVNLAQRRSGAPGTSAVLEVNTLVSGLAELLIYAALVFGVGAVTASQSTLKFSQAWLSAAFAVYLVDIGDPARLDPPLPAPVCRPRPPGGGRPAGARAARRPSFGSWPGSSGGSRWAGAVFNVLVVGAVYLMVFKPGS